MFLGSRVAAKALKVESLEAQDAEVGSVACPGTVSALDFGFGEGNDLHSLYTNGSTIVFRYVQILKVLSTQVVNGSDQVTFNISEAHDLSADDQFLIQASFNPSWTYAGLTTSDIVGGWRIVNSSTNLSVTFTISKPATSSGTTLTFNPYIAVNRFLYIDTVDNSETWKWSTTAPSTYHLNAVSQTVHL